MKAARPLPMVPKPLPAGTFLPGAHHPHCARHDAHLLWIRGRPFCLGCACMGSGLVVGVATSALLGHLLPFAEWFVVHAALVAPTALQPWVQYKLYKIVARFGLGIATGSYLLGAFLFAPLPRPRIVTLAILLLIFVVAVWGMLGLRSRRPNDPCAACPLGMFPTCSWNLQRLLEGTSDPLLAAALSDRERPATAPSGASSPRQ
jgi:hypothetical protein